MRRSINLKFCTIREILPVTFLLWEILKRHYFFKSVSMILYDKWMWQFFLFLEITKKTPQDMQYWEYLKYSLHRTISNLGIFTTLVYLNPNMLRAQRILSNLLKMYDGLFSTEACVTLVYSELKAYSEHCQISMMEILFTTLCNPSIFRTVAYSESTIF